MHKATLLLAVLAAALSACSAQAGAPGGPTPFIITATLPATPVPSITPTPVPPTATATTVPVDGMTTTQVNVRDTPSTAATQLAILAPYAKVQIVGKDPGEKWYMILYPDAPGGNGWVTAQYINVLQGEDKIPVIGGAPTPAAGTEGTPGSSASGTVIQQINVRKGPGVDFDALGTLQPQDVVTLTGKDPSGAWFQIQYAAGPDGLGWVASAFVDATGAEGIPIVGSSGEVVGTGTPAPTAELPTATPGAALPDNDSAQAPAAHADLSASGTRSFIFSSDVSAPLGDAQDWLQFTLDGSAVLLSLSCTGNVPLAVDLSRDGTPVPAWGGVACGETRLAQLAEGGSYLVHITIVPVQPAAAYVRYSLRIELTG